jgi:hypothetical protein
MKPAAYEKLKPFLHRKSARQRVILFLLADGYTVRELVAMDVAGLRACKLPVDLAVSRDETLEDRRIGPAFAYPNGKGLPHTAFYRLVRAAAQRAIGRPMSQEQYREWVNK